MPKFNIVETIHSYPVNTVRLGTTTNKYDNKESGKAVKLTADSRYELCAAGDVIEKIISSSNLSSQGTQDGYAIGGATYGGYKFVTFDGLQATPGTGVIAVGDYVVCGTVVPFGTALTGPLKVTKATTQANVSGSAFPARVVSLGSAGTGAAGTVGCIEFI